MNKDMKAVDLEQLEQVSGGYVVGDKANNRYCVVRQDGSLIVPAPTLDKAREYAKAYNVSTTVMTPEEYKKHFGREIEW